MKQINNKNGIEMYYELGEIEAKIIVLDSNGKYFNDLYYDSYRNDNGEEDIGAILHTLEETTLENMCNFFGANCYKTLEEMAEMEELELDCLEKNCYTNIFNVNDKTFYTWSW